MEIHKHYNGHTRELVTARDLPVGILASEFEYMIPKHEGDPDDNLYDPRFFQYRGEWYDTHEFTRATDDIRNMGFHAWQTQSYFNAIAIRWVEDYQAVKVAHLHW